MSMKNPDETANKRKPAHEITPEYEDSGIFKNRPVQITVELVPIIGRNLRQDVVVRGFMPDGREIEVIFAGRRARLSEPLTTMLSMLKFRVLSAAKVAGSDPPDIESMRCLARIEGSWRPKFIRDNTAWETRSYQLMAARWSVSNGKGNNVSFGIPAIRV